MYDRHRKADNSATLERPETPPKPSSSVPYLRDPDFIKRAELTDEIDTKLSAPSSWIALVGFGGVGKSQLAIEYCHRLRQQSPETWVLWLHSSNSTRFGQSVQDVADQLKLFGRNNANADILQLLKIWLRDSSKGRWLIVLDNVDDADFLLDPVVVAGGAQARRRRIDCIPVCDHGSVLITTRSKIEALKLVYDSNMIDVLPMDQGDAEALLEKKFGKLGSQAEKRQLITALDRIPLALTQAAAFIKKRAPRCSVQQYCEEMERSRTSRTSLLRQGLHLPSRDVEANNSVLLTWQISFEHVYRTRRTAAELLSLMSFYDRLAIPEILLYGHVDNEEAESSYSKHDFEEDIATLSSFSFVSITANNDSWEMHRLVQDATQVWLEDQGRLGKFLGRSVHNLYRSFPRGSYENWSRCRILFPHIKCAAEQKPAHWAVLSEWASVMCDSAWYALQQGNFVDALAMAESSTEIRLEQLGVEHPDTLSSMNNLASTYRNQGRWKEAEQLDAKVVETRSAVLGAEHPDTLTSMNNLASTYYDQNRWTESEELQLQVVDGCKKSLGPQHPYTLSAVSNLAYIQRKRKPQ
ncbi:hypothetical protein K431DRAFT_214502 [Polychaeton citri CBS 116435]|uniref:NB-ARC domain-containing protein n=1 Tax=Polychaeton citri CBS 116435 TaxID=1314669 RepID=A0A9P4QJA2_9PEZI|nr:hypothetical protein K431DRAFT_214502 [Polychaeton citri CBS 116435]